MSQETYNYDATENNSNGASDRAKSGKRLSPIVWVIIIVLGFVLLRKLFGTDYSSPDAELTEFDQDTIDGVLNGDGSLEYPFPNDNTPAIIEVPGGTLTDAQVIELTAQLYDRYEGVANRIAEKLQTDAANVFDLTVIMAATAEGTMTTQGLDLYFRALEAWAPRWASTVESCASALADIAASQFDAIDAATKCVDTVMVINSISQETYQSDQTEFTVTIENGNKGGFCGLFKKKSSAETRTTIRNLTRNDVKIVQYAPVCQKWQLTPTQLDAILAAGTIQSRLVYGIMEADLAAAPNPAQFVKPAAT